VGVTITGRRGTTFREVVASCSAETVALAAADARAVDIVQHAVACRQASRVHAHQAGSDLGEYCLDQRR